MSAAITQRETNATGNGHGDLTNDELDAIGARLAELPPANQSAALSRMRLVAMNATPQEAFDASQKMTASAFSPKPMVFDFDAPAARPDWIVPGVLERGTIGVLPGDTGAAKSILTQWLTVCALMDREWLGRSTAAIKRVLVVDEENPDGLVLARLRAMGITNKGRDGLLYFSREGFLLGTEASDAELEDQLREFKPDLVILDSLMSVTGVDVNDNVAAVAMMKRLRGWAAEHGCAILALHHERKLQREGPAAGSSQQAMGARQWVGQADALPTIAVESKMERTDLDNGHFRLRRTFRLRTAEKDRDGRMNNHRRIAVESEKDESDRLLWMTVTDEGSLAEDTAQADAHETILRALAAAPEHRLDRRVVAAAAGQSDPDPDGTFKRAWKAVKDDGLAEKAGNGLKLTAAGIKAAEALGVEF